MSFLSKYYSLVNAMYLLIRCYKTRFILWNTNTDRNGVNKQHTHTHTHTHTPNTQKKITLERVSMKISDTPPFLKQLHLFYQSLHFYGKNLNPSFSQKFWKKGGMGSNYALAFSSFSEFCMPKVWCFWFFS